MRSPRSGQPTPERKCIINLPSTVEHSTPNIFADMIEWMHRHIARRDAIVLSVHPHNDRGTGTAAGEFALMAGADRIEGCLFGNGERTGNVDLVNIALNLYTQGVAPGLDFSDIDEIRRTRRALQPVAGASAPSLCRATWSTPRSPARTRTRSRRRFAARKDDDIWDMPYLPIDPKDLGRSYEAVIRVNSQSGKGGISYLLESEYGLELPRRLQIEFSQVVQAVMDVEGKELTAQDIWQLFDREYGISRIPAPSHHIVDESRGATRSLVLSAEVQCLGQASQGPGVGIRAHRCLHQRLQRHHRPTRCACSTTTSTRSARAPTPRRWPTWSCASTTSRRCSASAWTPTSSLRRCGRSFPASNGRKHRRRIWGRRRDGRLPAVGARPPVAGLLPLGPSLHLGNARSCPAAAVTSA